MEFKLVFGTLMNLFLVYYSVIKAPQGVDKGIGAALLSILVEFINKTFHYEVQHSQSCSEMNNFRRERASHEKQRSQNLLNIRTGNKYL